MLYVGSVDTWLFHKDNKNLIKLLNNKLFMFKKFIWFFFNFGWVIKKKIPIKVIFNTIFSKLFLKFYIFKKFVKTMF